MLFFIASTGAVYYQSLQNELASLTCMPENDDMTSCGIICTQNLNSLWKTYINNKDLYMFKFNTTISNHGVCIGYRLYITAKISLPI